MSGDVFATCLAIGAVFFVVAVAHYAGEEID